MNKKYFTENLNQSHQKTSSFPLLQNLLQNLTLQLPLQKASSNHQNPERFHPTEAMVPVTRTYSRCQNSRSLRTPPWLSGAREIPAPGFLRPVGCQRRFFWAEAPDAKKDGSRSRGLLRKDFPNWHWKKTYLDLPKGVKVLLKSIQHLLGVNWHIFEGAGIQKKTCFLCNPTGSLSTEPLSYEGYRW